MNSHKIAYGSPIGDIGLTDHPPSDKFENLSQCLQMCGQSVGELGHVVALALRSSAAS